MIRPLLALVAGGLLPLALAPFDFWPAAFVSLALWFYVLQITPDRGLLLGWLFGVGKFGVGASWVYVSIHVHGNAAPPLALFLVALFVAGLALFAMANGWLFRRWRPRSWLLGACWFVFLFCAFEWLLTWFLSGFPWLYPGYAFLDTSLAGFAPVGGVMLVSFLVAAMACSLTLAVVHLRDRLRSPDSTRVSPAAAAGGLTVMLLPWLLGWLLGHVVWTTPVARHEVALVQGNIDQRIKWHPENRLPILEVYQQLSEGHWGVHLLLWPEAAITFFQHEAGGILHALGERARASGTGLILGLPAFEQRGADEVVFHNSAVGVGTASGRYVKRRLVPFGEYVPMESLLRGLIEFFDLPMSRAEPGDWRQAPLRVGDHAYSMAICYEVVYPGLVRVPEAAVLLTISNDTWFGESIGPHQHLQMARMRAVENGRWLLRSTNSGITAIVDPSGAVSGRLPQFQAAVLRGEFEVMTGRTPYARLGEWPLWLLLVVLGGAVWRLRMRED